MRNMEANLQRYETGDMAGRLVTNTWPGLYPIFYVERDLNGQETIVCPDCARVTDEDSERPERIVAADANYEDPSLHCDACGDRIPSAYADDD